MNNDLIDEPSPPVGSWMGTSTWEKLPSFPSEAAEKAGNSKFPSAIEAAYRIDAVSHSTNLIGKLRVGEPAASLPPWPTLGCS